MPISFADARRIPLLALLLILAGWLFLFRNDLALFNVLWKSEDFSYTLLVPLVAAYIAWQERKAIGNSMDEVRWPGLAGLIASGAVLLVGRLGSLETLIFFAIWLSIVSLALLVLGWGAMRRLVFPALVLLFIVPPPPFIENVISFQLRLISSSLSAHLLQLLQVPVYLEGNIIDLGAIKLQVVDACSGLRYLLPTILLSLITGYIMENNVLSRVVLVFLSGPISLVLNAVRITVTGLLVRYVSLALADGFFHDFQGWIIYLAAIALLVGASLLLKRFEPRAATPEPPPAADGNAGPADAADAAPAEEQPPQPQARPIRPLSPVLAAAAAALLVAMSLGTAGFLRAQIIPAWKPLESFPLEIGQWRGVRGVLDREVLDSLWCDDYFLGDYRNSATGGNLSILIPYYKAQTTSHTAHAPTSCFLGSGWELTRKVELPPAPESGRPFPVQQMLLAKGDGKLLSNFWFQQRGRIISNEFANKWYLFADAIAIQRTDGALVRIEMILPPGKSPEQAQKELDAFAGQVEKILGGFLPE